MNICSKCGQIIGLRCELCSVVIRLPNTSISGQPPIDSIDGKADEQGGGGD